MRKILCAAIIAALPSIVAAMGGSGETALSVNDENDGQPARIDVCS
jgi:hypothetical protein